MVTASEAAMLADIAARLLPLLPEERRPPLAEAVDRAAAGRARILVVGEAKRGKSTLVNALFERDLLPTGALPLTSVASVVTVARQVGAQVRYRNGRVQSIGLDAVADLVSQRGNPDNVKGVDRVAITVPSRWLPAGTEVVDTPGTGSIHRANTDESARARSTVDIVVLVVAADPPVSAAELALVTETLTTAAAAAVVVNKTDLVAPADLAEIVTFTQDAAREALGDADVPTFPMSLRGNAPVADLVAWLTGRLSAHGGTDVVASTARALRREATGVLDGLRVEHEVLRHTGQQSTDVVAALRDILDRAATSATAAVDYARGQARRARTVLDEQHGREVAAALKAARTELGGALPGRDTPEREGSELRQRIGDLVVSRCTAWFDRVAPELDAALRRAAEQAVAELSERLATARRAAEDVLELRLAEVEPPEPRQPPALPGLRLGQEADWRELLASTVARHLPAELRRRRLYKQTREWVEATVPRPFGRARAGLQAWLADTTRAVERELAATWHDHLAALQQGLAAAEGHRDRTGTELSSAVSAITERLRVIRDAQRDLDTLLATSHPDTATRSPVS